MPLAGIIFDFDGVLANSEPLHLRSYQEVLSSHGIELTTSNYYNRYLGFDDLGVFRAIAKDQKLKLSEHPLRELIRVKSERFDVLVGLEDGLFPGAVSCVRRIATEFQIGIASGAINNEIETVLSNAGIRHHFKVIVSSGDTPRSKPAPDPYLRAVELLRPFTVAAGHDPDGCFVAIEDSRWGIESALAAGLRCVGVAQTYPPEALEEAHKVVSTIGDIEPDVLRRVCLDI